MYRTSTRQHFINWIRKMLFLWSREPSTTSTSPRAGPWFAWFATAVLLWRCRHRIARVFAGAGSVLQLGLLKRLPHRGSTLVVSKAHYNKHRHKHLQRLEQQHQRQCLNSPSPSITPPAPEASDKRRRRRSCHQLHSMCQTQQYIGGRLTRIQQQQPRLKTRIRNNKVHVAAEIPRRLGMSASCAHISQQLYYRVTRSGRVYGRYPTKPPPIK